MIEAENIVLRLSNRFALSAEQLCIPNHKITALIGTNGSGKSTLSKILSGQLSSFSGVVNYDSKCLKTFTPLMLSQQRAVMPQSSNCHLDLNVQEVLEIGLFNQDLPQQQVKKVCAEFAKEHGIHHLTESRFNQLSGGEKQKCLLVQCLLQLNNSDYERSYLFLDEPMNNLDLFQEKLLVESILDLKARGLGILIILHDLNQVLQLADHVLYMKNGLLHTAGTPQEVLTQKFILDEYGLIAERHISPHFKHPSIQLHLPKVALAST